MFLTAISEYDQVLAEDDKVNRLEESVNLFSNLLNSHVFKTTNVVLFLNKKDLLEEKIKSGRSPVRNHFPDCPGDDYESAEFYFRDLFVNKNPNPEVREIFPHVTCATNRENIKIVDTAVTIVIMRIILDDIGIY